MEPAKPRGRFHFTATDRLRDELRRSQLSWEELTSGGKAHPELGNERPSGA